jgi:hypothetical protein
MGRTLSSDRLHSHYILYPGNNHIVPPYSLVEYPRFNATRKTILKLKNKSFVRFKPHANRERDRNVMKSSSPNAPVLHSSFFASVLTLPRRTCHHSASNFLAVRISCRDIAVFVFRRPLLINKLYLIFVCYTNITLYSFRYYPRFYVTTVGLGTYYPHIRGHTCT